MLHVERRRVERHKPTGWAYGELVLHVGDARIPVAGINDVSQSGVSVYLDQAITVPAKVALELDTGEMKIEVFGTAVWSAPTNSADQRVPRPGSHLLGVEVLNSRLFSVVLGLAAPIGAGAKSYPRSERCVGHRY